MKIKKMMFACAFMSILGCSDQANQSHEKNNGIEYEIQQLGTADSKRAYLEKILEDDQAVRDNDKSAELMLKYGKDSKEDLEYAKAQWKQDAINLQKIEAYLRKYGYPKKDELGKDAAMAPWAVIHHTTDTGIRNIFFEAFYIAYLSGDISDTEMALYLGRTYEFTFRERLQMESPYRSEDQINQLIEKLNLGEAKANAQKNAKSS